MLLLPILGLLIIFVQPSGMVTRRHHVHASLLTIFTVVGTMVLSPHIFLTIIRRSHGGSLVVQFPISESFTTFLPGTLCSRKRSSGLFIFSFLLEVLHQCNEDCILVNIFLIPLTSRVAVSVQVGGISDEFFNINGIWLLYPSTLLVLEINAKSFHFSSARRSKTRMRKR